VNEANCISTAFQLELFAEAQFLTSMSNGNQRYKSQNSNIRVANPVATVGPRVAISAYTVVWVATSVRVRVRVCVVTGQHSNLSVGAFS